MRALVPVALAVLILAGAEASPAQLPQQQGRVDLVSQANVELQGPAATAEAGNSVAAAGDVNGDGLEDIVVGAPGSDNRERTNSGSVFVVFGRVTTTRIDLATLDGRGYRIDGAAAGDRAGSSVAGIGDVDGDGRADLLLGASTADNNGRSNSGSAYVVFGKGSDASVDLAAIGDRGFRIDGATATERAGWSVAAAGDVNGDGRPDLLVGAPFADNNGRQSSGSAYVVFGSGSTAGVDLAALGDQGFRIDGAAPSDFTAEAIAGAGDVNADGRADVLVGTTFADNNARELSGSAYVVYGTSSSASVDLAALGEGGYRIDGAAAGDGAGASVAAGDVDGDGRVDLLVGAVFADNNGRQGSGSVYVLFGGSSSEQVDLLLAADSGFRVDGAAAFDFAGGKVARSGDMNGDGRTDLLVGAVGGDRSGREDSGSAYVVYPTGPGTTVDLAALGDHGFAIDGAAPGDSAGTSTADVGDVNGDLWADVLVGAPGADANDRQGSGSAYVVFGFGVSELAYRPLLGKVGERVRRHAPSRLRRTGSPRFSSSRAFPAGLRLDPGSGIVSGTPALRLKRTVFTVTMRDLTGAVRAPLAITVTDTRPPRLTVGGPATQNVLRQRGVIIRASCDEACRLSASGRLIVPGTRIAIALAGDRATLRTAGRATLRLRLSPAAQSRLAALLETGMRARALVSVRAVDAAGNARTVTETIALRP